MHGYIYIHIYIYLFMCVHVFLHRHNRCSHHSECISKLDAIHLHWLHLQEKQSSKHSHWFATVCFKNLYGTRMLKPVLGYQKYVQKDGKSLEVTPGDLTLFRSVVGWMETETFYVWPTKTTLSSGSNWSRRNSLKMGETFRGSLKGRVSFIATS